QEVAELVGHRRGEPEEVATLARRVAEPLAVLVDELVEGAEAEARPRTVALELPAEPVPERAVAETVEPVRPLLDQEDVDRVLELRVALPEVAPAVVQRAREDGRLAVHEELR